MSGSGIRVGIEFVGLNFSHPNEGRHCTLDSFRLSPYHAVALSHRDDGHRPNRPLPGAEPRIPNSKETVS
jgi:hypothetical protein